MRHLQSRPGFLQESDREIDALLLGDRQALPPLAELIGEFDLPGHNLLCHRRHYVVNGMKLGRIGSREM
jgi:hypothetical protein